MQLNLPDAFDPVHNEETNSARPFIKPDYAEVDDIERIFDVLAKLEPHECDVYRKGIAKKFNLRVSTIDAAVKQRRKDIESENSSQSLVETLEPWEESVNGLELLFEIRSNLAKHLVLDSHFIDALALWTLGTYVYDAFRIWPKLLVTSPEKRCGKTTLLEVLQSMVRSGLPTSNITPSAIFRTIDESRPTILIDEADTFLKDNEELRGIINSGHSKKAAFVIRCVGDENKPKKFSTWSPMTICMIKLPPDTIVDRSIVIALRRKLPGEKAARVPLDLDEKNQDLRRKCERWADDNCKNLSLIDPKMPACTNDRALDNWLPIFSIAESVGGDWPKLVADSFIKIATSQDAEENISTLLLSDIREIFGTRNVSKMFSRDLVDNLVEIEERQWSEWRGMRPMTQNSLARLLRPYGIRSKGTVRINQSTGKGYLLAQFQDVFKRYIGEKSFLSSTTPISTVTPTQVNSHVGCSEFQTVTQKKL